MSKRVFRALLPVFLLVVLVPHAGAQVLRGRVIDAATGVPVARGIVKADGADGELAAGTLTDADGRFALTVRAGVEVSSLTVERIGYATQAFAVGTLGRLDDIELRVDSEPVALDGIVVSGESLCRVRSQSTGAVAAIWDEARKSLEFTALIRASRLARFETETYQRDLDPSDYSVLRGTSTRRTVIAESPYRSISIEQMRERGWVEGSRVSGWDLYAPDARILLTHEFANQHCYSAEVTNDSFSSTSRRIGTAGPNPSSKVRSSWTRRPPS